MRIKIIQYSKYQFGKSHLQFQYDIKINFYTKICINLPISTKKSGGKLADALYKLLTFHRSIWLKIPFSNVNKIKDIHRFISEGHCLSKSRPFNVYKYRCHVFRSSVTSEGQFLKIWNISCNKGYIWNLFDYDVN